MNEPKTEKPAAEAESTSREDKFFGVKTSIPEMLKGMKDKKPDDDFDGEDFEEEEEKPKPKPLQAEEEEGASDDDVEQYSKNVQKRIDKLTWEKKENERQRKAAEAARDEAFRIAKVLHDQNQQQTEIITNGEARLIAEFKQRANAALQMANAAYKKAFEEGDSEAILKAQEQLFSAQSEVKAASDYEQDRKGRETQWKQQQQQKQQQKWVQQQQPQKPQVRKATEEAESWAKRNPWFGSEKHRDMTAVAYATHETMVRDKGIPPDSPQYFQTLDATMRARFPEYNFGDERSSSKPNAVVAPATRGRAASRKVKLNEHQRSLAKTLGISEELYARYSEMEMNRDK